MADIEEGQYGDKGRMRDWLSRAVRAPRDAVWTADGYVSDKWLPSSPLTGRIDSFEWKVPVEQLGALEDSSIEGDGLEDLIREPEQPKVEAASEEERAKTDIDSSGTSHSSATGAASILPELAEEAVIVEIAEEGVTSTDDLKENEISEEKISEVIDAEVVEVKTTDPEPEADQKSETKTAANKKTSVSDKPEEVEFPLKQRPDDPGVRGEGSDDPKAEDKKLFGIF